MMSCPGRLVEIAGRLVGDNDGGIGCERAGERDALLFAAGQFRRIMMQSLCEADGGKLLLGACKSIALAGEFERHRDVLQRRHGRDQMEGLENDADIFAAKARQLSSSSMRQILPGHDHRTGVGRSSPVITISSVDLPEPDGPSRLTASPRPILRSMSRRIWTRAAPRPSDRLTPRNAMMSAGERVNGNVVHADGRPKPACASVLLRSYGWRYGLCSKSPVQRAICGVGLAARNMPARFAQTPIKIVALGDS
jgi:hypothetical protein